MKHKKTILALIIFFIIVNIFFALWVLNINIQEIGMGMDEILSLLSENILFAALGIVTLLILAIFFFMTRTP